MKPDCQTPGVEKMDMVEHVEKIIDDFPEIVTKMAETPSLEHLFRVDGAATWLKDKDRQDFHTSTVQ